MCLVMDLECRSRQIRRSAFQLAILIVVKRDREKKRLAIRIFGIESAIQ